MAICKPYERQICDIQGRLFVLAGRRGYAGTAFVDAFMTSETAAALDRPYDRLQWAGEEYILEQFEDELAGSEALAIGGAWPTEALFWTGYLYRFWHYYTGDASSDISSVADAQTMLACWPGYHTLDPEVAIDRLKEGRQTISVSP